MPLDGPILTWSKHIEELRNSCQERLNMMKHLAGVKWGASRQTLLKFYKIYIKSKVDYGSIVYDSASQTVLNKLNIIQNTALRIILGAFHSSPIIAIQTEAGSEPLKLYHEHGKH